MGASRVLVESRPEVLSKSPISENTILYRRQIQIHDPVINDLVNGCYRLGDIQQIETTTGIYAPGKIFAVAIGDLEYEVCLLDYVPRSTQWTNAPFRWGAQAIMGEHAVTRGVYPAIRVGLKAERVLGVAPNDAAYPGVVEKLRVTYGLAEARLPPRLQAHVVTLKSGATGMKNPERHQPLDAIRALVLTDKHLEDVLGSAAQYSLPG